MPLYVSRTFLNPELKPRKKTKMKKRIVGVRHRQKKTKEGEARPTVLCIAPVGDPSNTIEISLEDEQDEIDWAHHVYPITFRDVLPRDKPEDFLPWHLQWKKVKEGESIEGIPDSHLRSEGKVTERLTKVPCEFIGAETGDTIVMLAGGSGNLFAHLLSRVGEQMDMKVMRISAARAKEFRKGTEFEPVENLHRALVWMYESDSSGFRQLQARHRAQVEIEELYKLFEDVQNDRKSCGLRLYQRAKRSAYTQPHVETSTHVAVEERHKALLASDPVHLALNMEEERVEDDALKIMKSMPIYTQVLKGVSGIGPRIALRLIASIPDISAFETEAQFCAFCGVHCLGADGNKLKKGETPPTNRGGFPRHKRGVICDWKPVLRQALFLFDDQLNRNPGSYWGSRRVEIKKGLRAKHPVPVEEIVEGGRKVKRYTDGHIQNMARWKTLNKFCRWLFRRLKNLERELDTSKAGEVSRVA
jgi:hypothetical protein